MSRSSNTDIQPIAWRNNRLELLDQRCLPTEEHWIGYEQSSDVAAAITDMVVRGAPAIGITAAFAVVLAARQHHADSPESWRDLMEIDIAQLRNARPTAVNLAWALERMQRMIASLEPETSEQNPLPLLLAEAQRIHSEDIAANQTLGGLGAALLSGGSRVLTHCNAGALATGGYGTALGVIRSAHAQGKIRQVYADETRPWLQGARLTAWELANDRIPVTLLVEGAAAALMQRGGIDWIVVGSDRIAANGDVANKIGTYSLAVNARYHGVRFMVAAPTSTIDMAIATGAEIPIEERSEAEIWGCRGEGVAVAGATAWNPAFDITPASLVDAIVTERGVVEAPTAEKMAQLLDK